jgi:hypothetical protein
MNYAMSPAPFDPSAPGETNPGKLVNALVEMLGLRNDAALSRVLNVSPSLISRLRHKKTKISEGLLLNMQEVSGMSIKELRALMGDFRPDDEAGRRVSAILERQKIDDNAVILFSEVSSVVIQRVSEDVLIITLNGTPAIDIGEPMFAEIRSYFREGYKFTLFFDLQKATASAVAIDAWTNFLIENDNFISGFKALAVTMPNYQTMNIIERAVRKPGLIRIFSNVFPYEACLISAKGKPQQCSR